MITIREPKTEEEFSAYYELRWRVLREPWNQPKESEKDDKENSAYHIMAFENEPFQVLGVGRIHMETNTDAQIRYMGVEKWYENQGIGSKILRKLEKYAKKNGAKKIFLNSRENAVGFYEKFGYHVTEKAHTLFDEIPHQRMEKILISD